MTELLRVTQTAVRDTVVQTLPLGGPLLALGWLIHLSSRSLERESVSMFGLRGYLYLFGWIGTLVHELGHAVFCPLFGHRIHGMRLFSFSTRNQSAGYVEHSYNGKNPYHLVGNFFISVGPLLLGTYLIYLVLRYLAGFQLQIDHAFSPRGAGTGFLDWIAFLGLSFKSLAVRIARSIDFTDYKFYPAVYLVLSIGSSMTLSPQDISSGLKGLATLMGLILLLNLGLAAFGRHSLDFTPVLSWAAVAGFLMVLSLAVCWAGIGLIHVLRSVTGR
ncbi:MAG: M50 family metallopeptidase [Candidatus Glassbacteria bacterium]|nr:M50 family metallopeptidase [Candidatus Glassbacteria bacterium]